MYISDGRLENQCKQEYCSGLVEEFPLFYKATKRTCIGRDNFYCGTRTGSKYKNKQCYDNRVRSIEKYRCLNRLDISETYVRTTSTFDKKVSSPRWNFFKTFETNDTHIWCGNETRKKECNRNIWFFNPSKFNCVKEGISVSEKDICGAIDFVQENYNEQQGQQYSKPKILDRKLKSANFI